MSSVRHRLLASPVAALVISLAAPALVACGPLATGSSSGSSGQIPTGAAIQTGGDASAPGDTNYAAMDEVPVSGGELRLAAPRRVQDRSGQITTEIGRAHV